MLTIDNANNYLAPYRLFLSDQETRAIAGELLSRGTGSSIEYQDHRPYFAGDDIRFIDWRAFARSDKLTLKMFRREISPAIDILFDASLSMRSTDEKCSLAMGLATVFYNLALKSNASVRLMVSGKLISDLESPQCLKSITLVEENNLLDFINRSNFLNRRSIKIIVSDFLFPHEPSSLVRLISQSADCIYLIQILSEFEAMPSRLNSVKLRDDDTSDFIDLTLDNNAIKKYLHRLTNLQRELSRSLLYTEGAFACFQPGLETHNIFSELIRNRIIEVVA